ncbi:MAG: 6-carboxytetrahydropterin synthase [Deltaproteobacteria bacterium]|nr:6-carboxytetrahydropterin synthase [Deltaproteobacteria bacterium]
MARFIFQRMAPLVDRASEGRVKVHSVSAWENESSCATYIDD